MSETWWQLLLAFGYGLGGSLIPVVNGEAFIVAAIATNLIGPVEAGICLGLGQGIGKMVLFQAVKHARKLPVLRRKPKQRPAPVPGTWRYRWSRVIAWGTSLVEHPRWGPLGLFLSSSVSVPPNYPTTILAATTKINFAIFAIFMTLGFVARYVVVGLAAGGLFVRFFS
ncbi:hypothetical protein [Propionimicrobium sp. PCR01-08-3]|uniref:hypothetical protein n=1 Tax=Propionimicrobium sp. PCR01-08-3 TaxID=3052086 RepID=UPI00255CA518|nr:hypothetical protein [Propionimicrobium sp. PCR01-08-3]WIY83844.1 hypothetical protein QQ658_05725 [Propionimicrobium sp. PCR01-08-3]